MTKDESATSGVPSGVMPSTRESGAVRVRYGWASIAVAVVFCVLYAYILWDAIGNLVQLPRALDAASVPWGLLVVDVALPVATFAAAFWLGRRHALPARILLFVVGLLLLACCTVGSIAFVQHS